MFRRFLVLSILFVIPFLLNAQPSQRDTLYEKKVESQLNEINPSMVEIFRTATIAMDKEDYQLADSLFSIVYGNCPDFDIVVRRFGLARAHLGDIESSIFLCKRALKINASHENLFALAYCYYMANGNNYEITENKRKALYTMKELIHDYGAIEVYYPAFLCQVASELDEKGDFRYGVGILRQKYPDNMLTHFYSAYLAELDEQWIYAEEEILKAKEKGLDEETTEKFLDNGVRNKVRFNKYSKFALYLIGIWAAGILLLFVAGKFLSNIIIKRIKNKAILAKKWI